MKFCVSILNKKKLQRLSRFYKGAMVPTIYLRDPVAYQKYTEYLNKREEELPLQTKVVIIFTNHRSGLNALFKNLLILG